MANPSLQPRVDDYDSNDDSDNQDGPVLESFRRSPAANVAAKRSHPSDLGNEKSPAVGMVASIDLQSDSGYSSHYTTGTMSSADSALSSPPSAPASAASQPPASPTIKRRPTISDGRKNSSQSSPRRQPTRSGSVSTRKPKERRQTIERADCTDSNCTKCGPSALPSSQRGRRPEPLQRDSALDVSYRTPPFDQRSQRSDPAPSYVSYPHSPTSSRPGPYTLQGSAIVQPAHSTRRRSSSTNRPIRPVSFHGGDAGNYYPALQSASYITPQEHRGPPPSMSTRFMHPSQMAPYMSQPPPPPANYYGGPLGHPMQTQSPYDAQVQRPPMPSRTPSNNNYHTRRPISGYGPPVVTQEQSTEVMPSARYAPMIQNGRQEPQSESESDSSDYDSSEEGEVHHTRALMPPPPPPPQKSLAQRRPSLRHAATTQVYNTDRRMSQSQTLPERPRERDSRDSRSNRLSTASKRAPSTSRPALIQHPKAQSAIEPTRNAQVFVESSKPPRRQSAISYEKQFEVDEKERRRANRHSRVFSEDVSRNPKIYADDGKRTSQMYAVESKRSSKMYAENSNRNSRVYEEAALVPTRRRQTESDARRREEQILEAKSIRATQDVEAYLRSTRGSNDPLIDKVHKAAKRVSRVPSGPSEAESSRSKGSGSNRTTMTNGANGDIRIRVDASAPLSLQFNGDMEGRTLHIEPTEDGMADIVIGNPGSRSENVYRSERGSIMGGGKTPKAIMSSQARRAAEESSVRSEHSSQTNRREGERRVLQRRRRDREPEYEYN